jgi:hypothetical protein
MAYLPTHTCFERSAEQCEACVRAELMQAGNEDLVERIESEIPKPQPYTAEEIHRRFVERFGE